MRETNSTAENTRVIGRDAGPAARIFRVLAGLTGLIPVVVKFDSVGAVLAGLGWLLVVAAVFVGIVALLRPWLDGSRDRQLSPWIGSAILLLPLMAYPMGLIPEGPSVGVRLFTDGSVLLAGVIGYGGLEMAALATLVLGFRPRLYSQYNVVDLVENAPQQAKIRPLAVVSAAVGLIAFSWFWIVPNVVVKGSPLEWAKAPTNDLNEAFGFSIIVVAALLAVAGARTIGKLKWSLTALVAVFGAGAIVGAMPDALYAAIIVVGIGVAIASVVKREQKPAVGAPAAA